MTLEERVETATTHADIARELEKSAQFRLEAQQAHLEYRREVSHIREEHLKTLKELLNAN